MPSPGGGGPNSLEDGLWGFPSHSMISLWMGRHRHYFDLNRDFVRFYAMSTTIEELVGSRLVIGFPGTRVTPDVVRQFKALHAGGVIFYRINFESPEQIRRVITELENALERRLLVCVDHEGGRVVMYRDGVSVFPDNLAFGHAGDVDLVRQAATVAANELRALGTDVNFAPVLDVLTDSYSPNIGIRSFGDDWKRVGEFGAAYIRALQDGGVSATAKHFPGKGHAPVDAHLKLPTIQSTWDEMKSVHLQPFVSAIAAGVDVVMSSHPYYPRLDPAPNQIATFSRRIITDCLRGDLNFSGVISSDDLEMGAVKEICPIGVAAVKTAAAGHDLLLSCHSYDDQRAVFNGLVDAYKGRLLPMNELEESVERIERLKQKRKERFSGVPSSTPAGVALARTVADKAVTVIQDPGKLIPLSRSLQADAGIVFPRLSSFAPKIMIEKEFEDETAFFDHAMGAYPAKHVAEIYGIEPDDEDIECAANLAKRSTVTVFFCFDAHLYPAEQKLMAALQRAARHLVVVLMRDPYDRSFLRPKDSGITAFGFRRCQLEAVIDRLFNVD